MTPLNGCLLILFAAACLAPILGGLRQRSGVLQFPFLAGCGLLGFLFPQAVAVARNGMLAPPEGVAKALLMCTLTALAVWLGWREPVPARWAAARPQACPVGRLYWVGLLFMTVGLVGFLKLTSLSGGVLEHYSTHGNYALAWKGMPVVYSFFELYLTPGFALCGLAAFALRSRVRLLPLAVTLAVQLAAIVFLGRRSALVAVLLEAGCLLYFGKHWLPPRRIVLCTAPLVALAMFLGPAYRAHSQIDSGRDSVSEQDAARVLGQVAEGTESEFWAAANLIQATSEDRRYGFGAGIYDTLILLFVPKLLVGEDVKAALLTGQRDRAASGWQMPYGMVQTGPGSAFCEFWYFGCLWFFGLSRLMRYLWVRAAAGGDLMFQAVYMCLLTPAVGSVVMDMHGIYPPVFMFWAPLAVLAAVVAPHRRQRPRLQARSLDFNPEVHCAVSR